MFYQVAKVIYYTNRVEADSEEEAIRLVNDMSVTDMNYDGEEDSVFVDEDQSPEE